MREYGEKIEITEVKTYSMTVKDICRELELKVYTGERHLDREVSGAYVSDLLSDVMGHAKEGEIWITLQSHLNVVAIASLKELSALILVKDIEADVSVLQKAEEEELPILGSSDPTFKLTGKLYELIHKQ